MGSESAAKNLSRGVSAYKICGDFYGPLPFIREIPPPSMQWMERYRVFLGYIYSFHR
jgi:hypothetical protein